MMTMTIVAAVAGVAAAAGRSSSGAPAGAAAARAAAGVLAGLVGRGSDGSWFGGGFTGGGGGDFGGGGASGIGEMLSEADSDLVTAAVARAEATTDAEIVTIVAPRSDEYRDIALWFAAPAMLLVPLFAAIFPDLGLKLLALIHDAWSAPGEDLILGVLMIAQILVFGLVFALLGPVSRRIALVPRASAMPVFAHARCCCSACRPSGEPTAATACFFTSRRTSTWPRSSPTPG